MPIVPPVSALPRQRMSGLIPASSQANARPVRQNPVAISSAMNRMPCFFASACRAARISAPWNRMPPAPCTKGSMIIAASSCETRASIESSSASDAFIAGNIHDALRDQGGPERLVHRLFRVGDRHRAEGVAVIAVGEAEEPVFPGSPDVPPVLQRDLERDLDGDRSGIREEDPRQSRRRQRRQPAGQPERRLVHQAAEHHVRHRLQLPRHALEDMRVIVAMADAPPRRDAVDQLAAIGQNDAAAVRPHDGQRRRRDLHLAVGKPDVRKTLFIPIVRHEFCDSNPIVLQRFQTR